MAGGLGNRGSTIRWVLVGATAVLALALTAPRADAYVNPFSQGSWSPGRIDMGVDMIPNRREPIRAIGAAKILGSTSHSGWPGGRYLWYQLISGSHRNLPALVREGRFREDDRVRRLTRCPRLPRGRSRRARFAGSGVVLPALQPSLAPGRR